MQKSGQVISDGRHCDTGERASERTIEMNTNNLLLVVVLAGALAPQVAAAQQRRPAATASTTQAATEVISRPAPASDPAPEEWSQAPRKREPDKQLLSKLLDLSLRLNGAAFPLEPAGRGPLQVAARNQQRPKAAARDGAGTKVLRAVQPVLMRLPPRFGKRSPARPPASRGPDQVWAWGRADCLVARPLSRLGAFGAR